MSIQRLLKDIQRESRVLALNLPANQRHFPQVGPRTTSDIKARYDALIEIENKIMAGQYDSP